MDGAAPLMRLIELSWKNYLITWKSGGESWWEGFKRLQTVIPPMIIPDVIYLSLI